MKFLPEFAWSGSVFILAVSIFGAGMLSGCSNGDWSNGTTNKVLIEHMDTTGDSPYRHAGGR
jgi:hypothetical protein